MELIRSILKEVTKCEKVKNDLASSFSSLRIYINFVGNLV